MENTKQIATKLLNKRLSWFLSKSDSKDQAELKEAVLKHALEKVQEQKKQLS